MELNEARELAKSILNIGTAHSQGEKINLAADKIMRKFPKTQKITITHELSSSTEQTLRAIGNKIRTHTN